MVAEHSDKADTDRDPAGEFCAALTFLTRLPVASGTMKLARASRAFPLVGAIVGAAAGGAFWLAGSLGLPAFAAAFLALIASAFLTGALHEDGLADAADGLFVQATPERKLEIMRDSRTGGFGALALVLITGLKASAIAALPMALPGFLALVAVHALARAPLPCIMAVLPPASREGLAARAGKPATAIAAAALAIGVVIAAICLSVFGLSVVAATIVVTLAVVAAAALFCRRAIGGYNGDTLGCVEQLAEATALVTIAAAIAVQIS